VNGVYCLFVLSKIRKEFVEEEAELSGTCLLLTDCTLTQYLCDLSSFLELRLCWTGSLFLGWFPQGEPLGQLEQVFKVLKLTESTIQ